MTEEKLLTIREVAAILGVSEKEVMDYAESGLMPAYKVGGAYLRFKHKEVEHFRKSRKAAAGKLNHPDSQGWAQAGPESGEHAFLDRVIDFFYFNDFYILSFVLIALLLLVIFKGY